MRPEIPERMIFFPEESYFFPYFFFDYADLIYNDDLAKKIQEKNIIVKT